MTFQKRWGVGRTRNY